MIKFYCSPLLRLAFLGNMLLAFITATPQIKAQTTSPSNQVPQLPNFKALTFVLVDDPNNEADSETGFGTVATNFQMGTYQVTAAQYSLFLNAVTPTENRYGLYDERMTSDPDVACINYDPNTEPHYKPIPG